MSGVQNCSCVCLREKAARSSVLRILLRRKNSEAAHPPQLHYVLHTRKPEALALWHGHAVRSYFMCRPNSRRLACAALSPLVKNVVDLGHLSYWLRQGRLDMLCRRFDWFVGVHDGVVVGERRKFRWRSLLWTQG